MTEERAEQPRDRDNWAPNIERLKADGGVNVGGRRLTGPQQGFGPMWQKTYTVRIPGVGRPTASAGRMRRHWAPESHSIQRVVRYGHTLIQSKATRVILP